MGAEEAPKETGQEPVDVTPAPTVSEEDQLAAKIKADFEALYGSRLKQVESQFENFRHGAYRIQEELKQENARLKAQAEAVKPAPKGLEAGKDPWETIQDGSTWKAEIERVADQKAEEKLNAWQAQQQSEAVHAQHRQTLDASKQQVIQKYPDLHPDTGTTDSLVAKTYLAVLGEHPDWLTNPYGPQLAMYAMEDKLKTEAATAHGAGTSRSAVTSLTPSRQGPHGPERLTLTREQKAFCDRNSLKYEDYIKTATALEQGMVEA